MERENLKKVEEEEGVGLEAEEGEGEALEDAHSVSLTLRPRHV